MTLGSAIRAFLSALGEMVKRRPCKHCSEPGSARLRELRQDVVEEILHRVERHRRADVRRLAVQPARVDAARDGDKATVVVDDGATRVPKIVIASIQIVFVSLL